MKEGALDTGARPLAWRLDHQACPEPDGGVHALTDVIGRAYALMLTADNVSDVKAAPALLEHARRMRYLLADQGYDADRLRRLLRDVGVVLIIPSRRNRKCAIRCDRQRYRSHHLIEDAFFCLKDFRRVATCYAKVAANLLLVIALATALAVITS